ncbi:MAG: replicative DNA helicase [Prevotella sp.]|nr:replicative DNA helicase [Bacteroides sp.]MCM1366702.1 replicative DNA helicase [Prevotella sp.]MCM1437284.1 replicative DNA helicase [Prevotella sp.]
MESNYKRKPQHTPQTDNSGKLPPRDTEVEQAVLGALMLEKDAYMEVCDIITSDSFYDTRHQKIYEAISSLGLNQRPIDMLTVTEELRRMGTLDEVGGVVYITDLTARVFSAAHVEEHAKIVAQKHLARRLIHFASGIENKAFDPANDVDDLLQEAEGQLFDISQTQLKREVTQIDPVLAEAMEQIQLASTSDTGLSGLQTGYNELDKMTSGWQNSDLIIIAARPAMGKTAFVLSMAKNMAVDFSIPVAIFTLEMANVQLVKRVISNVANLPGEKIKSGKLEPYEWERLQKELNTIYGAPLYLDETPGLSITELRTKARRLVRERGVRLIMIDYLQLMNATGMKFGSREQEVSTISRSLKALAKELNIPIIALSQLNRSTENRDDKRPVLSDLRESGAIEQDADIVCFIHREEYYTKSGFNKEGDDIRGQVELIIAKHRSGAVGDVKLRFVSKYARFENWDANYDAVQEAVAESSGPQILDSRINSQPDSPEGDDASFPPIDTGFSSPMPDIMPSSGEDPYPF